MAVIVASGATTGHACGCNSHCIIWEIRGHWAEMVIECFSCGATQTAVLKRIEVGA